MASNTIKGAGDIYEKDLYGDLAKSANEALPLMKKLNEVLKATTTSNLKLVESQAKDVEGLKKVNEGVNNTNKAFNQKLALDKKIIAAQKVAQKQDEEAINTRVRREKAFDKAAAKEKKDSIARIKASQKELEISKKATENIIKNEEKRRLASLKNQKGREQNLLKLKKIEDKAAKDKERIFQKERKSLSVQSNAYKVLSKNVNSAQARFKRLAAQYGETDKRTKKALITFNRLDSKLRSINNTARDGRRDVGRYGLAFGKAGNALKGFAGALGITAGIAGLSRVITNSIKIAKDFEQGNANLASVLGTTKDNITALTDDAKRLGATTSFTATQVSELQTEFAKLGFNEQEILNATEATLDLAAATGSELGEAAAIAGATLGGFGLDAKETGRVADVMAKSFSTSALDLEKFKESMKDAAPAAKAVGVSVEKTTALLGTLSNAGISGSKAGTALKAGFIELNAAGITLDESLLKIANSNDKLSTATALVGKRAATSFLVLADGVEVTKELEIGLNNAGGAAKKMADEQLDTLGGKTKILASAWEGLVLSLLSGDGAFSSISKSLVDITTGILGALTPSEDLADAWFSQEKAVEKLEGSMNPLLDRYDNLKAKTVLTKDEQIELDSVIQDIARDLPLAVTEFDKYGKAMDISSESARRLVKQQRRILEIKNAPAIKEEEEAILKLELSTQKARRGIERINGEWVRSTIVINQNGTARAAQEKITAKELQRIQDLTAANNLDIGAREAIIARLKGQKSELELLAEQEAANTESTEDNTDAVKDNTKANEDRANKLRDLTRRIEDLNDKNIKEDLERKRKIRLRAFERDIEDIKGNSEKENELKQALKRELDADLLKLDADYFGKLGKLKEKTIKDARKIDTTKRKGVAEFAEEDKKAKKEELDREEELGKAKQKVQQAIVSKLAEISAKASQKKIDDLDEQLEASKDNQDRLRELAAKGSLDAQQSISVEAKKQADLKRAKEKEERKQELVSAGYKIFSALLDQGKNPAAATLETAALLGALPAIIEAIPTAFEGTESTGTVKNSLDSNGGRLMLLHDNERVMTEKQNNKMGGINNDEAANIIEKYNMGELFNYNTPDVGNNLMGSINLNGLNKGLERKIDTLNESIKAIKMPKTSMEADYVRQILKVKTVTGNKIVTETSKLH